MCLHSIHFNFTDAKCQKHVHCLQTRKKRRSSLKNIFHKIIHFRKKREIHVQSKSENGKNERKEKKKSAIKIELK